MYSEHRQEIEKIFVPAQLKTARIGVWIQGLSHIVSGAVTIASALYASPWVPVVLALIYSSATVIIYMFGKTRQAEAIQERRAEEAKFPSTENSRP